MIDDALLEEWRKSDDEGIQREVKSIEKRIHEVSAGAGAGAGGGGGGGGGAAGDNDDSDCDGMNLAQEKKFDLLTSVLNSFFVYGFTKPPHFSSARLQPSSTKVPPAPKKDTAVDVWYVPDNEILNTSEYLDDIQELEEEAEEAEDEQDQDTVYHTDTEEEEEEEYEHNDSDDSGDIDEDSIAPNTYARGDTDTGTGSSMASEEIYGALSTEDAAISDTKITAPPATASSATASSATASSATAPPPAAPVKEKMQYRSIHPDIMQLRPQQRFPVQNISYSAQAAKKKHRSKKKKLHGQKSVAYKASAKPKLLYRQR